MRPSPLSCWSVALRRAPPQRHRHRATWSRPGGIEAWLVEEHSIPILALELRLRGRRGRSIPTARKASPRMVAGAARRGRRRARFRGLPGRGWTTLASRCRFGADRDDFTGSLRTLTRNARARLRAAGAGAERAALRRRAGRARARPDASACAPSADHPARSPAAPWLKPPFAEHPYGRPATGTLRSVAGLDRRRPARASRQRLRRDTLMIGVVGDITPDELALLLDRIFGGAAGKRRARRTRAGRPRRRPAAARSSSSATCRRAWSAWRARHEARRPRLLRRLRGEPHPGRRRLLLAA